MKTEPSVFSIDDLIAKHESAWDGVRNYQARNFMKNDMAVGDRVLFYHSSCEPPGVAGLAVVSHAATADLTALDKKSPYFDPKASRENPIWYCVKLRFDEKFPHLVPLEQIRKEKRLSKMLLLKRGQRLSIQPVTKEEFDCVRRMGKQ